MNSDLHVYENLRDRDLRREGLFIVEGRFLVERLLASSWQVASVLCSERMAPAIEKLVAGRVPFYCLPDRKIERIAGFPFHRGVLAAGIRHSLSDTEKFLYQFPDAGKVVVCPDITGAENMGGILRSAAALGVDAVIVGKRCCDPLGRKSLKVSMGAPFRISLVEMKDETGDVEMLRAAGFHVVGTVLNADAQDIKNFDEDEKIALVFGNEADGLSPGWERACDSLVTLPMKRGTDSLNVSVAAGIFIYELFYR